MTDDPQTAFTVALAMAVSVARIPVAANPANFVHPIFMAQHQVLTGQGVIAGFVLIMSANSTAAIISSTA